MRRAQQFRWPHPITLSQRVRSYLDEADIKKHGSCHMLRHTVATLMLENTHVTIQRLREVHDTTHPARPDDRPPRDE